MKLKLSIICVAAALAVSACQSTASGPGNAANAANAPAPRANTSANTAANQAASQVPANATAPVNSSSNLYSEQPKQPVADTPTDTFKALVIANGGKDLETTKMLFNQKSLEMVAGEAKQQNKTLDQMLLTQRMISQSKAPFAIRNEKIDGDEATLEVKSNSTGNWETLYFTHSEGRWKLAMDKYMEAIVRQVEESSKSLDKADEK
jgi:hypothetical protein